MGSAVEGKRTLGFYLEDLSKCLLNLHVSVPSLICTEGGDGELGGGMVYIQIGHLYEMLVHLGLPLLCL